MTRSASPRRSRIISRSAVMPSSSRPSPCSGCGRRAASCRRTSTSSVASRKRIGRPGAAAGRGRRARRAARRRTSATADVDDDGDPGLVAAVAARPGRAPAPISCGGRLSTTNQPRSSSTPAAVLRPAPVMPGDQQQLPGRARVIGRLPASGAPSSRLGRGDRGAGDRSARLVQRRDDRLGRAPADARHRGHLVDGGGPQPLERAEAASAAPCGAPRRAPARRRAALSTIDLDRRDRWWVMANRCASSRTRCSRYSPSLVRGSTTGSSWSGSHTSSSRLASPHTGMSSMPSSASACAAAATCGGPPSTTTRPGAYANLRGRPVSGSTSSGPSSPSDRRRRRRRRPRPTRSTLLVEHPAEPAGDRLVHAGDVVLARRRPGSRTGGTRSCAAGRPRTPPSTRPPGCPAGWTRRSTRSAAAPRRAAAPAGSPPAPGCGWSGRWPAGSCAARGSGRRCARRSPSAPACRRAAAPGAPPGRRARSASQLLERRRVVGQRRHQHLARDRVAAARRRTAAPAPARPGRRCRRRRPCRPPSRAGRGSGRRAR